MAAAVRALVVFGCVAASRCWAAGVQWPSDNSLRQWALEKRGVGVYGADKAQQVPQLKAASWAYDWRFGEDRAFVEACAANGVEYLPMIWNVEKLLNTTDQRITDVYLSNQTFPNTTRYLLGFNEPNKLDQGTMSAEMAALNWPLMEKAARRFKLKLASPVPATCGRYDCGNSDPFQWWDDFFANCTANLNRTCHVDVMAMHFYVPCDVNALQKMIAQIAWKYNKPIFITEFGCWDADHRSVNKTVNFMRRAMSYLDSEPRVLKYAWWSPDLKIEAEISGPNSLWYGTGNQSVLTGLGKLYLEQLCPPER